MLYKVFLALISTFREKNHYYQDYMTRFNNSPKELLVNSSKQTFGFAGNEDLFSGGRRKQNQKSGSFDLLLCFFSHIFWRRIFSKSSITFHYKHLGSFTLFFVCAECMGWYFENICKYTVKPAIVVTSIRRNLRKLVSLSKFQM